MGILVAAHAHGDEGMQWAVRAGVATIEHGTLMSEETMQLMVEQGTYYCSVAEVPWHSSAAASTPASLLFLGIALLCLVIALSWSGASTLSVLTGLLRYYTTFPPSPRDGRWPSSRRSRATIRRW